MTRIPLVAWVLLALGACSPDAAESNFGAAAAAPAPSDEAGVAVQASLDEARAAVERFHAALSNADSAAVLSLLHPDAIIYEAGHAETVEEYRTGHLAADIRFASATEREVVEERAVMLDGHALLLAETRVRGTMGEREIDSRGAETMVLSRDGGAWLIRHIHWSNR